MFVCYGLIKRVPYYKICDPDEKKDNVRRITRGARTTLPASCSTLLLQPLS